MYWLSSASQINLIYSPLLPLIMEDIADLKAMMRKVAADGRKDREALARVILGKPSESSSAIVRPRFVVREPEPPMSQEVLNDLWDEAFPPKHEEEKKKPPTKRKTKEEEPGAQKKPPVKRMKKEEEPGAPKKPPVKRKKKEEEPGAQKKPAASRKKVSPLAKMRNSMGKPASLMTEQATVAKGDVRIWADGSVWKCLEGPNQ